jgi:hypothetical protein
MVIVLFSVSSTCQGYLSKQGMIAPMADSTIANLKLCRRRHPGAGPGRGRHHIIVALIMGMAAHRQDRRRHPESA